MIYNAFADKLSIIYEFIYLFCIIELIGCEAGDPNLTFIKNLLKPNGFYLNL